MKGNPKMIAKLNELLAEELTAINQYMVHSEMCDNWGYVRLHKAIEKTAVDEIVRYSTPVIHFTRTAAVDVEIGGRTIGAGERVLMVYASANRDAAEFERPDEFDLHRSSARDLTYGAGGHKCLGMHLATLGGELIAQKDSFLCAAKGVSVGIAFNRKDGSSTRGEFK